MSEPIGSAGRRLHWPIRASRWTTAATGLVVGIGALIAGLVHAGPLVGLAGFVIVLAAVHRVTRRLTWVSMLVRSQHRHAPATPDEHLWEP